MQGCAHVQCAEIPMAKSLNLETLNPKPETRNPKHAPSTPQSLNPKPSTPQPLNPKPLNPLPATPNSKPPTPNPEPRTKP
jgi:hypothetical protein